MTYTINTLRQALFERVFNTYEIFKNFFGEQFTDLQGVPSEEEIASIQEEWWEIYTHGDSEPFEVSEQIFSSIQRSYANTFDILVWWPEVTVTNENNKSVNIQDLYAKITIKQDGTIPYEYRGFKLTRSTFSPLQYASGYVHSHIPRLYGLPHFDLPCLGIGPIKNTVLSLQNNWDEMLWMLFCQELSLYVTVESLRGGPYINLESIGNLNSDYHYRDFVMNDSLENFKGGDVEDFIAYYLKNTHLSFDFKNESFTIGSSYYNFIIDISNCYIAWFNQTPHTEDEINDLYNYRIINFTVAANGRFYNSNYQYTIPDSNLNGTPLNFTFKGVPVRLRITEQGEEPVRTTLLNNNIASGILHRILKTINHNYKHGHNSEQGSTESSTTNRKVIYV